MSIDRSIIRVKAMLITTSDDGSHHLVSVNDPTDENPSGFHRLIGGSVELGATHKDAIIREVREELGAQIIDLQHLGIIENIFRFNGEVGHEIVALYTGTLNPAPVEDGGTLTESDGTVVPVVWRPIENADPAVPLYPAGIDDWVRSLRA
ncbi:NUDIX domain-containing protein [Microbacterium sp. YY-01]|uniref:NUDIX domain-containing protein n=1 Tax=Microbacterium sp. YY-01 TaxID=3421634 RepID=UPI003D1652EB